jgi:hypothetical protein
MMIRLAVILALAIPLVPAAQDAWAQDSTPAIYLVDPVEGGWYFASDEVPSSNRIIAADFLPPEDAAPAPVRPTAAQAMEEKAEPAEEKSVPEEEKAGPVISEFLRCIRQCSSCLLYVVDPVEGGWYFNAEAVWLTRDHGDPIFLGNNLDFIANPAGAVTQVLASDDEDNPYQLGPRLTLGYRFHYGDEIELSYVGTQHWTTGRTLLGDPVGAGILLTSPFLTVDNIVSGFDTALGYVYSSEYHDAAVTYRHIFPAPEAKWQPRLLFGFRYISLDEDLELTGVNEFIFPAIETLRVNATNDLLGGQVGAGFRWLPFKRLTLDVEGKTGLYANIVHQDMNLRRNTVVTLNGSADEGTVSCGVDAGVRLRFAVKPDVVIRAGYDVMYLSGLALAPEQLDINIGPDLSPTHLNDTGTAFFHGPSVGLELLFGGR